MSLYPDESPLVFEGFRIDPREHQLSIGGVPVRIGARAFQLLMVLVEHRGHLITKDQLLQRVWPNAAVEENTLQVHVSALRKALGAQVIVTVPGLGYRFVAPARTPPGVPPPAAPGVGSAAASFEYAPLQQLGQSLWIKDRRGRATPRKLLVVGLLLSGLISEACIVGVLHVPAVAASAAPAPTVAAVAPAPAVPAERSIAVLPFADLSTSKDQRFIADGMTEALTQRLARDPALRVSARTSSPAVDTMIEDIPAIAHQLKVGYVIEGSVRTAGKRLRIAVQLVRAENGFYVWSQTFDRNADDVLALEDEVSGAVVMALAPLLPDSFLESSGGRDNGPLPESARAGRPAVVQDPPADSGNGVIRNGKDTGEIEAGGRYVARQNRFTQGPQAEQR